MTGTLRSRQIQDDDCTTMAPWPTHFHAYEQCTAWPVKRVKTATTGPDSDDVPGAPKRANRCSQLKGRIQGMTPGTGMSRSCSARINRFIPTSSNAA